MHDWICDACDEKVTSIHNLGWDEGKLCFSCYAFHLKEDSYACPCGKWEAPSNWSKNSLLDGLCFNCSFWEKLIRNAGDNSIRIDGVHYMANWDKPMKPRGYQGLQGFAGSLFRIKHEDGRYVETNDLWYQGNIPVQFRERLPDNAEFVKNAKQ